MSEEMKNFHFEQDLTQNCKSLSELCKEAQQGLLDIEKYEEELAYLLYLIGVKYSELGE